MAKRKTRAQVEAELKQIKLSKLSGGFVQIVTHLIKWGGLVLIAWHGKGTIECLAGENTFSNISINFLADLKVNQWIAHVVGFTGVGYGLTQRRLRKNTVEKMQKRTTELETEKDPGRSSSNLTARGDTRPEDEI